MNVDIDSIYGILKKDVKNYKVPVVDLVEIQTKDPFKVLLATILSARTKDETTLKAVKKLFSKVKKPSDLEKLSKKEIETLIYPVGFYHNKADHLKKFPLVLKREFNNIIPSTIEELVKLPGVGRKTANIVLSVAFNKNEGIAVDTHVARLSKRLNLTRNINPKKIENDLLKVIPEEFWGRISILFILHGRTICQAKKPDCNNCMLNNRCPYWKEALRNK